MEIRYRYAVVETFGVVPEQITRALNEEGAYLLYPEDRGVESQQDYMRGFNVPAGGWVMERRGAVRVEGSTVVEEFTEAQIADKDTEDWN